MWGLPIAKSEEKGVGLQGFLELPAPRLLA